MSIKISELPVASSVNSADIVPIVQDGTTKQAQAAMFKPQIETAINSSSTNDKPVGAKAVYDSQIVQDQEIINLQTLRNVLPKVSAKDTSITLDSTGKTTFYDIVLIGNTAQNGTPTVENPVDINVVTGDNTLKVYGKNLFDNNVEINSTFTESVQVALQNYLNYGVYAKGYFNNKYDENAKLIDGTGYVTSFTPIESGKTYTIKNWSSISGANFAEVEFLDENGNTISHGTRWGKTFTHTATSEEKFIAISVMWDAYKDYVQIEENATPTQFYGIDVRYYTISLSDIELNKLLTYEDSIIFENGDWYVQEFIEKYTIPSGTTEYTFTNRVVKGSPYFSYYGGILSARKLTYSSAIPSDDTVYVALLQPVNTKITDTTLIGQLNAIKNATSCYAQTNIRQTNDDLPFIINATAIKDLGILSDNIEARLSLLE